MSGSSQSNKQKQRSAQSQSIDPILEQRGDRMAALGQFASALGYQPNRGVTIAGFTPMQEAAFANINNAANAFGMAAPRNPMAGMPATQMQGGISGYSSAPHYDAMVAQLPPQLQQAIASLFINPETGQGPAWATTPLGPENPFAQDYYSGRTPDQGYNPYFSLFSPTVGDLGGNAAAPAAETHLFGS